MLNFLKTCIKAIIGIFFVLLFIGIIAGDSSKSNETMPSSNGANYVEGYLLEGAIWNLESPYGQSYTNYRKVKIEIWKNKFESSKGEKFTQFYFLEGDYAGSWGWTPEKYTIKK